jgi:uncharacterized protein (TIGR00645 family)
MSMIRSKSIPERWFERSLFASRWLMAPIYFGLLLALVGLLAVFVQEVMRDVPMVIRSGRPNEAIVMILSLIDLSLAGNLILMVTFSGYEIFISKIDTGNDLDRPDWLGKGIHPVSTATQVSGL